MKRWKHYIMIRMNLYLYRTQTKHPGKADAWMADRMQKFANITVPSLRGQTCQDFEIVCLWDSKTPKKTLTRAEKILKGLQYQFIIVETVGRFKEKDGSVGWARAFSDIAKTECRRAVMTRLDNDDALARDAVKNIQECAQKVRGGAFVIDMPCGVMWDKGNDKAYLARHKRGSPFITLVEDTGSKNGMLTVYWHCHNKVASHEEVLLVSRNEPGWLMVVHDNNCTNRIFEHMIESKIPVSRIKEWFDVCLS